MAFENNDRLARLDEKRFIFFEILERLKNGIEGLP